MVEGLHNGKPFSVAHSHISSIIGNIFRMKSLIDSRDM